MASFINPYLKKAREEVMVPEQDEQVEGVVELVQELFKNLLDDDEEETFKEIIKDLRNDGAHQTLQSALELQERPLSPTRSDVLSATDRTYKLKKIEQKVSNFKNLTHQIWQHIKFHENELRKALKHQDEELAMLLNPLDKKAKRDESTQTALTLNTQCYLDYSPFSPIMQQRALHNPLLVMLTTFRHHQSADFKETMFRDANNLERGVLFSFLNQAIDQRFKNCKSHPDFSHFFLDYLYTQFGSKKKVVLNFELIYKSLKRATKRTEIAKELMNLLGVGESLLTTAQEAVCVRSVQLFRELLAKQTLLRSSESFLGTRSPTLETPSPAAEYERIMEMYEIASVNVQDVIDRFRRMGYATDSTVKEEGVVIFEQIYSDYRSEKGGEDSQLLSALAKLELQEERQRKPHKRVFQIIDKEKKGEISTGQMLSYIRDSMQVFWTQTQIDRVLGLFDPHNTEMVTRESFLERMASLNLKAYQRITLAGLMKALRRAQKRLLDQEYEVIVGLLEKYNCESLTEQEGEMKHRFQNCLKSIDPSLKYPQILKYYKEVLEKSIQPPNLDRIEASRLFDLVEKYKIGGFGQDILHNYSIQ